MSVCRMPYPSMRRHTVGAGASSPRFPASHENMIDRVRKLSGLALPSWAPLAALAVSLAFAWAIFLTSGRCAAFPGVLHGWRLPWYGAALAATTVLTAATWRQIGQPV